MPIDLLSLSLDEKELIGTLAHVLAADLGPAIDLLEHLGARWYRIVCARRSPSAGVSSPRSAARTAR